MVSKLSKCYGLTIIDLEPEVCNVMECLRPIYVTMPCDLWLLGEPGKRKTPLGRIVAMMISRCHGWGGSFRTTSDLDFFRGIPFTKAAPALYLDGSIGNEKTKKKRSLQMLERMNP